MTTTFVADESKASEANKARAGQWYERLKIFVEGLPPEVQTDRLGKFLFTQPEEEEKVACAVVEVVRDLYPNDPVAFREALRKMYRLLPGKVEARKEWPGDDMSYKKDLVPEAKRVILSAIIVGWGWQWVGKVRQQNPDAKDCFEFLEGACGTAASKIRGVIRDLIIARTTDESCFRAYQWSLQEIDAWIDEKFHVLEITQALLTARLLIGRRNGLCGREVRFLKTFKLHQRSLAAITFATSIMQKVAQTDAIAASITETALGRCFGESVSKGLTQSQYVSFAFESEFRVRVKITLTENLIAFGRKRCSKIVADLLKARKEAIEGLENPPEIVFEVCGPEGFEFKES